MIITISGYPGSGKTTVGKMLAKKLGGPYYSIGGIRRAMAKEKGMTLEEFNRYGETHPNTDREVDAWQAKRGAELTTAVFEGRTAFHFVPHSVKLFFEVTLPVAAHRIMRDTAAHRRFEANWSNLLSVERSLKSRMASDTKRYKAFYGLDIFDRRHYDLVINTTRQHPEDTLRVILTYLAKVKQKKAKGDKLGVKRVVVHKKVTSRKKKLQPKKKANISKKKLPKG